MRFRDFSFGSIRIDGTPYDYDVVIDRGEVRKRKKKPSKRLGTRRYRWKRRYPGNVGAWWLAPEHTGDCR
jgi:hypothetical protein